MEFNLRGTVYHVHKRYQDAEKHEIDHENHSIDEPVDAGKRQTVPQKP